MKGGEGKVKAEQYLDGNHQLIITKVALLQSRWSVYLNYASVILFAKILS